MSKLCLSYVTWTWDVREHVTNVLSTSVYGYPLDVHLKTSNECPKRNRFISDFFGQIMDVHCTSYLRHSSDVRHRIFNGSKSHPFYVNKSICDICRATHKFNRIFCTVNLFLDAYYACDDHLCPAILFLNSKLYRLNIDSRSKISTVLWKMYSKLSVILFKNETRRTLIWLIFQCVVRQIF